MRPRYPCQDLEGLPAALREACVPWLALSEVRAAGRCHAACVELLPLAPGAALAFGAARHLDGHLLTLHYWLDLGGRVLCPTRQQFGRGPVEYRRFRPEMGETWVEVWASLCRLRDEPGRTATLWELATFPEPVYQDDGWISYRGRRVERMAA